MSHQVASILSNTQATRRKEIRYTYRYTMPLQLVFKKISHLAMCAQSLHFTNFDVFAFEVTSNTKNSVQCFSWSLAVFQTFPPFNWMVFDSSTLVGAGKQLIQVSLYVYVDCSTCVLMNMLHKAIPSKLAVVKINKDVQRCLMLDYCWQQGTSEKSLSRHIH